MNKTLIAGAGIIAAGALVVGAAALDNQPAQIILDTATAKNVVWNKPTTDKGWADDVKAEQLDMRSDTVLQNMLTSETAKLAKEQEAFIKYHDCLDCIYYDDLQNFLQNGEATTTAMTDASTTANTDFDQRQWEIEKIEQSIERINHELDLRSRSVVVPDETVTGAREKASKINSVAPDMVRHIID